MKFLLNMITYFQNFILTNAYEKKKSSIMKLVASVVLQNNKRKEKQKTQKKSINVK